MPRVVEFKTDNKIQNAFDFPKLKLEQGESARVAVLESPVVEYRHTLERPKVLNGKGVKETKKRKDGSEYQDWALEFMSSPLCLGDPDILDERGSDTKNCPVCALAAKGDYVKAPVRRYAMHIIQYNTKPGGSSVATPFQVNTKVWAFSDTIFNKIIDFANEFGDLTQHDLLLGPCTNKGFQKYDISISAKAEWSQDEERKTLTKATFSQNRAQDLVIFCGAKKEQRWLEEDLSVITDAWSTVLRGGSEPDEEKTFSGFNSGNLDEGISGLLDSTEETFPAKVANEEFNTPPAAPVAEEKPKNTTATTSSFEDLLSGL